jgi:hypothetical protein
MWFCKRIPKRDKNRIKMYHIVPDSKTITLELMIHNRAIIDFQGPIEAVFSIVHCTNVMDRDVYLSVIKYCYWYLCDLIYFVDTFFHIVHR